MAVFLPQPCMLWPSDHLCASCCPMWFSEVEIPALDKPKLPDPDWGENQLFPCIHCCCPATGEKFGLHTNYKSGSRSKSENLISIEWLWLLYHPKIKHSGIPPLLQIFHTGNGAHWTNLYY